MVVVMDQKLVVVGDGLLQGLPRLVVDVHSLEQLPYHGDNDDAQSPCLPHHHPHQYHGNDHHHDDYLLQHLVKCRPVSLLTSCQENLLPLHRALHVITDQDQDFVSNVTRITFILTPLSTVTKDLIKSCVNLYALLSSRLLR